jgi:hypothetical protein
MPADGTLSISPQHQPSPWRPKAQVVLPGAVLVKDAIRTIAVCPLGGVQVVIPVGMFALTSLYE